MGPQVLFGPRRNGHHETAHVVGPVAGAPRRAGASATVGYKGHAGSKDLHQGFHVAAQGGL
jgi:hypothetical protein